MSNRFLEIAKIVVKRKHIAFSLLLSAIIILPQTAYISIPKDAYAQLTDYVSDDVILDAFYDENGVSVSIYIPDSLNTIENLIRIYGERSGTLYKLDRRVEAYESVIKEIVTRPLTDRPKFESKVENILLGLGVSSSLIGTIVNGVEWVGMGEEMKIQELATGTSFKDIMYNKFKEISNGAHTLSNNPLFKAAGDAVKAIGTAAQLVDLHFATLIYQALATEEAKYRLDALRSLNLNPDNAAWSQALTNAETSLNQTMEQGYWGNLLQVINDRKSEIASGTVSLFVHLISKGHPGMWGLGALMAEWKIIMGIIDQEKLVQNASIVATIYMRLSVQGNSGDFRVRQLLEYSQVAFYDYMVRAFDTGLTKFKDFFSQGTFGEWADYYKLVRKFSLTIDKNLSPSINITNPVDGSPVSGSIMLSAQIDDNIGVARVIFKAAGQTIDDPDTPEIDGDISTGPTAVFPTERSIQWNTSGYSGSVVIEVTVYDASGNTATDSINVTVDSSLTLTINLQESSVAKDTSFTISGKLTDAIDSPLQGVTVSARIGYIFAGSGDTDDIGDYSISATAPSAAGSFNVTVEATYDGNNGENSAQLNVTDPKSGHDVAVRKLELDSYSVRPGHTVNLEATFDNEGEESEELIAHWYIYPPGSSTPADSKLDDNYGIKGPGGTTGEVSVPLTTNSQEGVWTARVWLQLDNDADPADNQRTISFYVGMQPDIDRYGIYTKTGPWGTTQEYTAGSYTVTVGNVYSDLKTEFTIQGGPTVRIYPDETYFYDGGKLVIFHQGAQTWQGGQVSFEMWTYPPTVNFNAASIEAKVPRGGTATYRVTSSTELTTWVISRITSDGETIKDNWDYDNNTIDSGTWDFYCNVPNSATIKTYVFWYELKFGTIWVAQKVQLEVLPEHDVSVSNLNPPSGSSYDPGANVPISATVSAAGGYTEQPNITLSIMGPGGYPYTDSKYASITGSQTVNFSPWDTSDLQPGDYTITVAASIGTDSNGGNNSQSSTVHINAPPQLVVSAEPDSTTHLQGDIVEIKASVTINGTPVSDANVVAHINWPDGSQTKPLMSYYGDEGVYVYRFTAIKQGIFSGNVTASKPEYSDGSGVFGNITVSNSPPNTMITSSQPIYGGWSRQTEVMFNWIGADTGTPISQLQYAWKIDDASWASFSGDSSTTLSSLNEGPHSFYVKAYDGTLEDPTPASRTFSVDSQPPSVEITTNGGIDFSTDQSQIILRGTADDPTATSGLALVAISTGDTNNETLSNWSFTVALSEGTNELTVTAVDNAGNFYSESVTVNLQIEGPPSAPVAEFSAIPTSGAFPLDVQFTDESIGTISNWSWDFSDGNTNTQQNPSHEYATPGTFTVSLTVTGPGGTNTKTINNYITVSPGPFHHVAITPANPKVVITETDQFSAIAQDQYNNQIPGATFTWSVTNPDAGWIDANSGLFTAGTTLGVFADVIQAETTVDQVTRQGNTGVTVRGPATIIITAKLQGGERPYPGPPNGYDIPITINLYDNSVTLDVSNILLELGQPNYVAPNSIYTKPDDITITKWPPQAGEKTIVFEVKGLPVGTYKVTVCTGHCLINLASDVVIQASGTQVNMGELLEGNADDNEQITGADFSLLLNDYLQIDSGDEWHGGRCDFDYSGQVTSIDFSLLIANYNKSSPQTVE